MHNNINLCHVLSLLLAERKKTVYTLFLTRSEGKCNGSPYLHISRIFNYTTLKMLGLITIPKIKVF